MVSQLEFSVPFNDDGATMREVLALREHAGNVIREIYIGAPQSITGTGRVGNPMDEERFEKVVKSMHRAGIGVDITMNSTCEGADWYDSAVTSRTVEFVRRAHELLEVEAVTLANPFYISEIRAVCPDLEISASVLSDIDCYERAAVFAEAGANTITPDTAINRDLKLLSQITQNLGVEIKLMVNEGCLYKCPYRKFHMNYISHASRETDMESGSFSFACGELIEKDAARIFQSNWVRPEELARYANVTNFFKIVGRDMLRSKVIRALRAYMEESYDGNLLDLLCSSIGFYNVEHGARIDNKALGKSSYFKRLSTCNRKCHSCTYCKELAEKYVSFGSVSEENLLDMGQYELAAFVRQAHTLNREPMNV